MTSPAAPLLLDRRRGAVIFDRDGVLNVDTGFAHRPDQIVWVEDAAPAVRAVNDAGLYALVATNQSGIARGLYGEAEVEALHAWMRDRLVEQGARIDAFAFCPHHPDAAVARYASDCDRRKPGPGMVRDLLASFAVEPAHALMIGDRPTDVQAAQAAGVRGVLFEGGSLLQALTPHLRELSVRVAG